MREFTVYLVPFKIRAKDIIEALAITEKYIDGEEHSWLTLTEKEDNLIEMRANDDPLLTPKQ